MLAGDNWSLPQVTSRISHVRHWLFVEDHMRCALLNVTKLRLQLLLQWSVEKQNLMWWKSFNLRWWALYFQRVTPETLSEKSCQCRNATVFHLSELSLGLSKEKIMEKVDMLALWNSRLSSKGMKEPSLVDLSHVRVLRQTGRRMRAILSFTVSMEALATHTQ